MRVEEEEGNAPRWVYNHARATAPAATAGAPATQPPPALNEEQQLAVGAVVDYAASLDAYVAALNNAPCADGVHVQGPLVVPRPEPLRMLLTGTAGTGKTVVITEMVRLIGRDRFKILTPTGNAACAIGGQVKFVASRTYPKGLALASDALHFMLPFPASV